MRDVADDRDLETFESGAAIEDGASVEQRLGGVFVSAVSGVDDGGGEMAGEEVRGARGGVPHHNRVRPHGGEGVEGVDERFTFGDAGAGGRDGYGVGAHALGGDFEAGAG